MIADTNCTEENYVCTQCVHQAHSQEGLKGSTEPTCLRAGYKPVHMYVRMHIPYSGKFW